MRTKLAALALVTAGALGFAAAPAVAEVSISSFSVTPASTLAGSAPDITVDARFASGDGDTVKDAALSLAAGLLANPSAPTVCSQSDFASEACPASSQIGDGTITANAPEFGTTLQLPLEIFLLDPQSSGELARIGVVANLDDYPVAAISAPVQLRTSPDVGLDIPLGSIPNQVDGIGAQIQEITLKLYGTVNGSAFTRLPTSCGAALTGLSVDSYGAPSTQVTSSASFTPTGCSSLEYKPQLSVTTTPDKTDDGAQLDTSITQGAGESATKDLTLTLPSGLSPRLSALLSACTATDLQTCPAVGTATVTTPLEGRPVLGKVVLAANAGGLPSLDAVFPPPFDLVISGAPTVGPSGLEASFEAIPDLPLTRLDVDLDGGPDSILTAGSPSCTAPQTASAHFDAYSGASTTVSSPVTVQECGGPGGDQGAKPSLSRLMLSGLSTGHPRLKLTLKHVSSFAIALPQGLAFKLHGHKGISISGAKLKRLKLSRGWLVVTLSQTTASVTATLSGPLLTETATLERRVKHHKLKSLALRFRLDGGPAQSRRTRV